MGYLYTTFAAALMVIVLVGGHLRASLGDEICGTASAAITDQKTFGTYVEALLQDLVKNTPSQTPPPPQQDITYTVMNPANGAPGSATGTGTCYHQGDNTVTDCTACLGQLLPFLKDCEATSASGGAYYEGRCMIQFWEVTASPAS